MTWEYKIVGLSNADAEAHLNRLGADGWELVGFEHSLAHLKRQKLPETQVRVHPQQQYRKTK